MVTRRQLLAHCTAGVVAASGCVNAGGDEFDAERVEQLIHDGVNKERTQRGIPQLEYLEQLSEDAAAHSRDMARRDFVDHTNPDGEGPQDRASVPCPVGENIAQTYVEERVETPGGGTRRIETPEEAAEAVVAQWLNSAGHRQNLLSRRYSGEGVGVHVSDDDELFATQMFCA